METWLWRSPERLGTANAKFKMSSTNIVNPAISVQEYVADFCDRPPAEVSVQPVSGDASTRQYFRAALRDGRTFVIARYPEPFDPETLNYCDVTKVFQMAGLPIPQLYGASGTRAMIIQEDLGDLRLQEWIPRASQEQVEAVYRRAIELIVRIQDATEIAQGCNSIASALAFDEEKLTWEMEFFLRHYFESYLRRSLKEERMMGIRTELKDLVQELASRPRLLCHRDFHARNLMLHEGQLFIIDHQDARLGPVSYDLVSLLEDPYVELGEELIRRLQDFFVATRNATPITQLNSDWQTSFAHEYQLMAVQRLLKVMGTYSYQSAVLHNDVYVPYLPLARQRALKAMMTINKFSAVQSILGEEERA